MPRTIPGIVFSAGTAWKNGLGKWFFEMYPLGERMSNEVPLKYRRAMPQSPFALIGQAFNLKKYPGVKVFSVLKPHIIHDMNAY